ncbi:MAG: YHS domain-containing (seleno)protein [Oceanospirillaceae bacterium]
MSKTISKKLITGAGFASVALLTSLSFSTLATAADEHNVAPGLTAAGAPLGLHGVDPVAAISTGKAVEGSATFTATHEDVAYYFSDAASMKRFQASPASYIPQNGGFCTFGVSVGKKFDGDPNFASIVDGKLYVFLNEDIYKLFLKDKAGTIAKAEQQWKSIEHATASAL